MGNIVEDVRIVGNRMGFTGRPRPPNMRVVILASDGCWPPASGVPCDNFSFYAKNGGNPLDERTVALSMNVMSSHIQEEVEDEVRVAPA